MKQFWPDGRDGMGFEPLPGALLRASLPGMLRSNAYYRGFRVGEFLGRLNRLLFHSTESSKDAARFLLPAKTAGIFTAASRLSVVSRARYTLLMRPRR